jgi:hypothetical protein
MALALMVLAVAGLALAQHAGAALRARWTLPTGPAQWIWAERDRRNPYPTSFFAVRDFTLAAAPARARLLAIADEEYVVYLNGKRVGADSYHAGARLDAFEVAPLLRAGGNRLAAELRSSHGEGGFLASLEDSAGKRRLVVTDASWRIFDRWSPGVVGGWTPLDRETKPALVWGLPPIGRWGSPVAGRPQPLFRALTGERSPLPGVASPAPVSPLAERTARPGFVELDWGREVAGYLEIEAGFEPGMEAAQARPPADEMRLALLYTGSAPPPPAPRAGDRPAAAVLFMPGEREWQDVHPRRFRYCLIVGLERPLTARVHLVDAAAARPLMVGVTPADQPDKGVFGISPPRLHTPVEDEVGRQIERLEHAAAHAAHAAKAKSPAPARKAGGD